MGSVDAGADGGMGSAPAAQIPLGQLGRFKATMRPPMIKSEGGLLTGWVYVDITSRDMLWGGLISLTILTLAVIPVFYVIWRGFQLRRAVPGWPPVDAEVIREGAS